MTDLAPYCVHLAEEDDPWMRHDDWLMMEPAADGPPAPFRTRLAGAGRHLPDTHLTTEELMSATRHRTHIDLERLTGIRERRVSVGDEDSFSLATAAAQNCLANAGCDAGAVDAVISFDEETPIELIRRLKPDILVKGADYTIETVVGADVVQKAGGRVVLVDLVAGKSTTNTIGKLRAAN